MKYFANYAADAVIKEDDNGVRYIKSIHNLKEHAVGKESPTAWGEQGYGVTNYLEPISKEKYDGFGIEWDWSPINGQERKLSMS